MSNEEIAQNGWKEYKLLVLQKLEDLSNRQTTLENLINSKFSETDKDYESRLRQLQQDSDMSLDKMSTQIDFRINRLNEITTSLDKTTALLKYKISLIGSIAATIVSIISQVITHYL